MDMKRICKHIGILPSRHVDVSYLAPPPPKKVGSPSQSFPAPKHL